MKAALYSYKLTPRRAAEKQARVEHAAALATKAATEAQSRPARESQSATQPTAARCVCVGVGVGVSVGVGVGVFVFVCVCVSDIDRYITVIDKRAGRCVPVFRVCLSQCDQSC